jgi:hypothetical protein
MALGTISEKETGMLIDPFAIEAFGEDLSKE